MKKFLVLAVTLVTAAAISVAFATASPSRRGEVPSGALHVTKECGEYNGKIGAFCTITSSNIPAIEPGMKVVYLAAPAGGKLDTDIALGFGQGTALGHVVLDLSTASGEITLSGGTGKFSHFRAHAVVSVDKDGVWHWDGEYRFGHED